MRDVYGFDASLLEDDSAGDGCLLVLWDGDVVGGAVFALIDQHGSPDHGKAVLVDCWGTGTYPGAHWAGLPADRREVHFISRPAWEGLIGAIRHMGGTARAAVEAEVARAEGLREGMQLITDRLIDRAGVNGNHR